MEKPTTILLGKKRGAYLGNHQVIEKIDHAVSADVWVLMPTCYEVKNEFDW